MYSSWTYTARTVPIRGGSFLMMHFEVLYLCMFTVAQNSPWLISGGRNCVALYSDSVQKGPVQGVVARAGPLYSGVCTEGAVALHRPPMPQGIMGWGPSEQIDKQDSTFPWTSKVGNNDHLLFSWCISLSLLDLSILFHVCLTCTEERLSKWT